MTTELAQSLQRWLRSGKVGELPMQEGGGLIPPRNSICLGTESFASATTVDRDLRAPPVVAEIDPQILGSRRCDGFPAVGDVLCVGADSQVYPAVIQRVVVDVVNHLTNLRSCDFPMQKENLSLAINAAPRDDVTVNTVLTWNCHHMPIPSREQWRVALVNLNGMAADDRDEHQQAGCRNAPTPRETGCGAKPGVAGQEETNVMQPSQPDADRPAASGE
jgi:hypothetical protein